MKRKRSRGGDEEDEEPAGTGGDDGGAESPMKRRKKSIEQTYQKKTQVQHILLRPDTYVGSIEKQDDQQWIWDPKKDAIEYKDITYVPALYKIFDEILVNAADNLQRDPKQSSIKVDIDPKKNRIRVWNNGKGLPIAIHKKHKVFVPELVFGHLLTSDNYDDSEKKVTGGRNGFGAKLTNIFSTKFTIETCDKGKVYKQTWTDNMSKKGKPTISRHSGENYTMVEFYPDLKKFGMKGLDGDVVGLMHRRVLDVAGVSGDRCKVSLNGKQIKVKNFEEYCGYFYSGDGYAYARVNKRWEVLVACSDGDGFSQNSFVNSIATPKGGTHVQYVLDQISDGILKAATRANKGGPEIKKVHIRNNLYLFINCLIENPAFSSQTKEQMTLKPSKFGSDCNIGRTFMNEILENTPIVEKVVALAQSRLTAEMNIATHSGSRTGKRILGVPKLEDANEAGGKDSKHCTLILTEGDSAKALAVAGLSVIGRDRYGVFPLRGKLLNVRDVQQKQVSENKEIMAVVKILGLSFGQKNPQGMRYGHVMIMADQDLDGSHIKGLLINLFHHWWPKLLQQRKGGCFLQEFVTPIVKCIKGPQIKQFFTVNEYDKFKKKNQDGRGWKMKYYKGLGTSTAAEAKEYFKAIVDHRIEFKWKGSKDGRLIDMAFNKKRADDRKNWMNKYKEGTYVDHSKKFLSYSDFVNLELVQYSRYDLMRSVPSFMDGFKPTQRKVLFSCFKRNLKSDVKVAQLMGYASEHSAYHHGEASMGTTIVGMAQDFVGSNNINLLVPSGQFGTRISGGKDHASARYIYTRLAPVTRLIFHPDDDAILDYQYEEGQKIEPMWYAPIIPMVLVNGATGIGTGWSTEVPNYDPREVIANLKLFLRRKKMKKMDPWYRGFAGTIKPTKGERGKYDSLGVWTEQKGYLDISELPIKRWTSDYKEFLQGMLPGSDKRTKIAIQDVREYHTENKVLFSLRMDPSAIKAAKADQGIQENMKLRTNISENNMVLFDREGKIKRYKNVLEIMYEFAKIRLKYYEIRKKYLMGKLSLERDLLSNRARFIGMIIAKKLHVNNRPKKDVVKDLSRLKFRKFGDTNPPRTGYEYLLSMQILSLTKERKEELEKMLKDKTEQLNLLKRTTIQKLWDGDLDRLDAAVKEMYGPDGGAAPIGTVGRGQKLKLWKGAKKGKKGKGKRKRGAKDDEEDGEEEKEAAEEGEEGALPEASVDSPFNDGARWIAGDVARLGPGGKKRRR